jgi:hypothetical protein
MTSDLRYIISSGRNQNKCIGISAHFLSNQNAVYSLVILELVKGQLKIARSEQDLNFSSLESVLSSVKELGARVSLRISGAVILSQPIQSKADGILTKGISDTEFVIQTTNTGQERSICRIEHFDKIKDLVASYQMQISNLYLGHTLTNEALVGVQPGNYRVYGKIYNYRDSLWEQVHDTGLECHSFVFDSVPFTDGGILALATSYDTLRSGFVEDVKSTESVLLARNRWNNAVRYFRLGRHFFLIWLIVSFLNAIVFFYFHQRVKDLSGKQDQARTQEALSKKWTSENNEVLTWLNATGWMDNQLPVFYLDELGISVGEGIQLTRIAIGVPQRNSLSGPGLYDPSVIKVFGQTNKISQVNIWTDSLSKRTWVSLIYDEKFSFDPQMGVGNFEFTVKPQY